MASGHGTSSSPPPPLPICVVPLNTLVSFLFLWRVSKEGVPSHGMTLCFTSANLLEGFKKGRSLLIARASIFTSLYWLMWFDFLPLLGFGPWWACHFLFCFLFFFVLFREREKEISKHQCSRRTPYPFNAASDSNRRECAHCCWGGWFWVLMRAPACLEPSLKYKIFAFGSPASRRCTAGAARRTRFSKAISESTVLSEYYFLGFLFILF